LRQCGYTKSKLFTFVTGMSLLYTIMYKNQITSDLIVPVKYSPYKSSLELFEAGYKIAMVSSGPGRNTEYWKRHEYLATGLEISTHNQHYWELFLPVDSLTNRSFFLPENHQRFYGDEKISILVSDTEEGARYYAKATGLEMSEGYSCHLAMRPLKGVKFFHWFRVKTPFSHEALRLVEKLSAGGFLSFWNKTENFMLEAILTVKEKELEMGYNNEMLGPSFLSFINLIPIFVVMILGLLVSYLVFCLENNIVLASRLFSLSLNLCTCVYYRCLNAKNHLN